MRSRAARVPATLVVASLGLVALTATAAHAAGEPDPPPKCFRANDVGELPTCTWTGSSWEVSYDGGFLGDAGAGIPSGFGVLFVLVALVGIGLTIWRVSLARQMATESGMDPDRATAVTLLSDDGLDATYLASSLRGGQAREARAAEAPEPRSVQARLQELLELRDAGLVTYEEYESRRKSILDSL